MKIDKKVELLKQLRTLTDFRKDEHKIEYPPAILTIATKLPPS